MRITLSTERYWFDVGNFKCLAVSDGTSTYTDPPSLLFANAPREHLEQKLREHDIQLEQWREWISTYTCLLINTNKHWVLVDTGAGGLESTTGKLIPNLQAEGIAPKDIDVVILTHGHPDHICGNVDSEGKPAFPNARYIMLKDEWDFWTSEPNLAELHVDEHMKVQLEMITVARNNLLPIQDRLFLVDRETEIVTGIRVVAAPGHTSGHMAVAITSESEQLLYISDLVLHPIHLEQPGWYAIVDLAPERVVATRRRLFNWAAAEKVLVHAFHFPFPGLGHVVQKGEGWRWQPIETMG